MEAPEIYASEVSAEVTFTQKLHLPEEKIAKNSRE